MKRMRPARKSAQKKFQCWQGSYEYTTNTVITFTNDNKIQFMTLSMSVLLHMLNQIGWPEYFRQIISVCVLLRLPVNIEISKNQQMSIASGKSQQTQGTLWKNPQL